MPWVDLAIVIVLALATLGGLRQGFFRAVCALGGLFLGLLLAAWNYARLAAFLMPWVRFAPLANTVGFLVAALAVMAVAAILGAVLAKTLHWLGLGWLDKLAGAAFGLLQGALLITLCILVAVAFFPAARWLTDARLPRFFFGACHLTTHMSPAELAERVRHGLRLLQQESPRWLHPQDAKM